MAGPALSAATLRRWLADVVDPEIPVITIDELGILREVAVTGDTAVVTITPTYSGCPAMEAIRDEIRRVLELRGVAEVEIRTVLAPAWTTDWISDAGRRKLEDFGIAPPGPADASVAQPTVCPQCRSDATTTISEFGSTACKALMVCDDCGEPFDHFKAL